ncbi:DUF6428 family protein [Urechidicola sp. KH5]
MKTAEFLNILESNLDKSLLFEFQPGKYVGANYHITEVKHISVDSVDCGAGTDAWKETVVQLWESPSEIGKREFMTVYKALSILKKVGRMKAYNMDAELKIEYSNATFHTAQLFVADIVPKENQLVVKLSVENTKCKAPGTCGVPEPAMAEEAACCDPSGGCC